MNKETMAREYLDLQGYTLDENDQGFNDFIAGFDAGQEQSAKLLAEKDKEIERLRKELFEKDVEYASLLKDRDDWVDGAGDAIKQLSQAKELVKIFYGEHLIRGFDVTNEIGDKIKALLGEE